MAYIRGKKVLLTFYKDGLYVPFLCATDCAININTETVDTRTVGDGYWEKPAGQSKNYGLSLTGLIELQATSPVTFWLIENYDMQMLPVPYRMRFIDDESGLEKLITGNALIVSSILNGVPTGFATSSFEMKGVGIPAITDSATSCNATIGEISVGPGDPDSGFQVSVSYEDVVNAARLEYSIDGGAREVIFDPGSFGAFSLSGLSEGSHTITVWAVCASGVDGESNELVFEIEEGGEPGPTCAIPGTPTMLLTSATTATASWTAASPAPDDGYYWELINMATSALVDSDTTAGLSVDLIGLDNGAEYMFRVRSVCETGVSESSFVFTIFTAEGETCARPGPLTIIYNEGGEIAVTYTASPSAPADGYYAEIVDALGNVTPIGYTFDLQTGTEGLTDGETYIINVYAVCSGSDMSSARSISFVSGGETVCNVPGSPVMSLITDTTATATWTAPTPAPADGYEWQVLNGVTVIDSGTTAGLSVNLTGLPAATSLTFKVRSVCETGVSLSGYNSVGFTTDGVSCAAPTDLSVGTITTTTAVASWTAASPAPAAGYDWYVIEAISGTIVASGNTATTSVNMTGLTPATQYDFVVRSVCEIGVSYSVTVTETFVTM